MAKIEEELENQGADVDCETQGSVFTITFDNHTKIVINKQEPLLELWIASKLGGFHFAFKMANGCLMTDNVLGLFR